MKAMMRRARIRRTVAGICLLAEVLAELLTISLALLARCIFVCVRQAWLLRTRIRPLLTACFVGGVVLGLAALPRRIQAHAWRWRRLAPLRLLPSVCDGLRRGAGKLRAAALQPVTAAAWLRCARLRHLAAAVLPACLLAARKCRRRRLRLHALMLRLRVVLKRLRVQVVLPLWRAYRLGHIAEARCTL